ncbi:MAG: hypothetical protein ACREIB_05485 [Pseudomonadota bacterium]
MTTTDVVIFLVCGTAGFFIARWLDRRKQKMHRCSECGAMHHG